MAVLLVSACLLGLPARYNGATTANQSLKDLLTKHAVVPVCPEQLGGLETPRPACNLIGGDGADVLAGRARVEGVDGQDRTEAYVNGAQAALELARLVKADGAVFQARSPSCGSIVRTGSDGAPRPIGVAAARLMASGYTIIEAWEDRLTEEAIDQLHGLGRAGNKPESSPMIPAPIKPLVEFNDLEKLDIRLGTIVSVEDVAKSDKLVKLTVDLGDHRRTVLAGLKRERPDPNEIKGLQALFVVNLPPRKMMGLTSEAMLFDLGYADKLLPALALPERPLPNGTRAG